jgi:hypothetical protein
LKKKFNEKFILLRKKKRMSKKKEPILMGLILDFYFKNIKKKK